MDPFSISVGALQIVNICSNCTITVIKWVGDVRTVDQRIRSFYDEMLALSATYEGLGKSLKSPLMIEAARVANGTSDGAHLWSQVRIALDDSTKTIKRIKSVLDEISKHTGPLRSVKRQFTESLSTGELSRLRQRIQYFNATISLPIQMVCVMLQLEQRGMSTEHQKQLDFKFMSLERTMRELIQQLSRPSRSSTLLSGSTLIVGATNDADDIKGKENYLTFAKKILSTASAAATTRSSLSTVSPQIDGPSITEFGSVPPACHQPLHQSRGVPEWLPTVIPTPTGPMAELHDPDGPVPGYSAAPVSPPPRSKASEVSYKLANTHLKLGQAKADQGNHESAEKSLRKALDLLSKHDFAGRISLQPAEVVLLLAHSCLQQKKYADTIELLKPVAAREVNIFPSECDFVSEAPSTVSFGQPDSLLALAASHMLGEVYRQQGDYDQAKEHALKAFLDRTDELGEHDAKTLESVRLVIQIYRGMGDEEEAEAYEEEFLTPTPPVERALPSRPPAAGASEDDAATISMSPTPSDYGTNSPTLQNTASTQTFNTQQVKNSRPNIASRLRKMRKSSQPSGEVKRMSAPDFHRNSFSRATTLDDTDHAPLLPATRTDTRYISTGSETSNGRTTSHVDNASTAPSCTRLERSYSIKSLEPTFQAISQLCSEGKTSRAIKIAMSFLERYNASNFIIRRDAMEKNIKEGGSKGLAATGYGYSPLHFFCELKEECVDEVSLLIRAGADVNCIAYKAGYIGSKSPDILTPLHLAIKRNHTGIAQMLLEVKDIRPDVINGDGFVPLLAACRKSNEVLVQTLLTKHIPRCIPRTYPTAWYGNSVLHDAARHCDLKILDLLLSSGHFDVDQQDEFGKTALMHAVIKSDVSDAKERAGLTSERMAVVMRLIEMGANKGLVDNKGVTARGYAEREREGSKELVAVLGEVRFEMA